MLSHILKQIWKNRKANGWIFAELVLVTAILWQILDVTYVDTKVYYSPSGYNIENVWFFQLDNFGDNAPGYAGETDGAADLIRLREQIALHPMVEEVAISFFSAPYSFGNSWTSLYPIDGDTLASQQKSFQVRRVTPEYFDVFRIVDADGKRIAPELARFENPIVISADMEKLFFPEENAKGKRATQDRTESMPIAAVCTPIRANDFEKSEACFYQCLKGNNLREFIQMFGNSSCELSVRMKKSFSQEEINNLLIEMGDRLTVNNLYVYSAKEIKQQRKDIIGWKQDEIKKQHAIVTFVLVNVFFGIVGTFWLRMQSRKEEIGLRLAIGSSRQGIKSYLYKEGLLLLALTIPFTLIYLINLFYFDIPDTHQVSYSIVRFLATFGGTYLLIGSMIIFGISLPARKASRMQPAEALHYE